MAGGLLVATTHLAHQAARLKVHLRIYPHLSAAREVAHVCTAEPGSSMPYVDITKLQALD